ncbi:MAG: DNA primase [Candidatus Zixiibacteriota bacterium]|nr:MAG: DNA primase [candidate division Zixibacteria bacterium]
MIPQETIEQVRQATDIVQVIGEYIRLKKRGRNFLSLCPFHTEKTASFSVSPDKQIYHCFGCGKGGNVFTFLMEHEKMSFIEAVRHLARKANIPIREERTDDFRREILDRLNYANQVALEYFQKTLTRNKYTSVLNGYLIGKRAITREAIEFFSLGLAGDEWEGFLNHAQQKELSPEDLEKAGLVMLSEKTGKYFDRFRHRLMIPIFNLSQKPIAFGGRTLKKGETAKYVNSPETPLYVKGNILYGLNLAREAIRQAGSVLVVEGYFDLISLWQIGVTNVVASSGTAFTAQQARLLARFAENVYLFFDADSAGRTAALRSVDALYDAGLEVKIIEPPEGEDPDSLAHKYGRDKIDELLQDAIGFVPYRIKDFDRKSAGIIAKEKLVKEFQNIASKIADATRRSLFLTEAAQLMAVDQSVFQEGMPAPPADSPKPGARARRKNATEAEFLSLLFNNPGTIDSIFQKISPDDFDSRDLARLYAAIINQYQTLGVIDARKLIDNSDDESFTSLISEVASVSWDEARVEEETRKSVKLIMVEKSKRIRARLQKELARAEADGDQSEADRILQELRSYGLDAKKDTD